MKWIVLSLCVLAISFCASPSGAQPAEPPASELDLRVIAEATTITVAGAQPGAEIVVLGVGRWQQGFLPTTTRFEQWLVADGSGVAEGELDAPIPAWSVWAAVDLSDGRLVLAGPGVWPLREAEAPPKGLGATLRVLEDDRRDLELLVVRAAVGPGNSPNDSAEVGAWGASASDGGASDTDAEVNGRLLIATLDLRPVADSPPPPEALAPGDWIVGIDAENLRYYALRLASPPAGGGGGSDDGEGGE